MTLVPLEPVVRTVVNSLVKGEYSATVNACFKSRLTADDIRQVIQEYGCTFVKPPSQAYRDLDVVAVQNTAQPTWSVCAPLWSKEEGRSDLTLEVTLTQVGERWEVELDDLHVL